MGCRTESAAVHIAHVLQKLHFFQFFNFFGIIYTTYCKKKITRVDRKKKSILFYNLYDLPQKKLQAFTAKKITRLDDFFVHELHFSL